MRESFRELVENAQSMNQDMWDDLGNLARARGCIPAFFKYCLDLAQSEANQLVNISTATPEGREQADLSKGAARGLMGLVGEACDKMGDLAQAEMEAEAGVPMEDNDSPRRRSRRRQPAAKLKAPTRRKHPAPRRGK